MGPKATAVSVHRFVLWMRKRLFAGDHNGLIKTGFFREFPKDLLAAIACCSPGLCKRYFYAGYT